MEHEEKEILIRLLRAEEENTREIARILYIGVGIQREIAPKPLTASITIHFTGENMANNTLVFNVGQTSQASIIPLFVRWRNPVWRNSLQSVLLVCQTRLQR